jgi:uncharacterized protein YfaS (alpha-2-macroglobulin family)
MRLAFGGRLGPMLILPIAMLSLCQWALAAAPPEQSANSPPALDVLKYDLAANQDIPELCFLLSESVARGPAMPLESFVVTEPAAVLAATPRKDRLCLTGFAFGGTYTITLKAGLPGISGALAKDTQFRVEIPNRPPEFDFAAAAGDILPRLGDGGLPIRSVNVPKIEVRIVRVADGDLAAYRDRAPLTGAQAANFAPAHGEAAWQGAIDLKLTPNVDTVTRLPIDRMVGALKPGLYIATAKAAGVPDDANALPTQYFTVSDIGLSAYRGPDSLLVAVRSLSSAAAAPGIDIALVAANNRELARVRSDGNGLARFDATILHGTGGDRPASILAYGVAGEFSALALGGDAPAEPRPVTALIHVDRAAYRPGDEVDLLALVRNDQGMAVGKLPLTIDLIRPNGLVFSTLTATDSGAGSYIVKAPIPKHGSEGTWRVEARANAGEAPIGSASFAVATASPSRLSVALSAEMAVIDPAQPVNIAVQTQYPEALAANIPGELRVSVAGASVPFPAFPDFAFGLTDQDAGPTILDPLWFSTDAGGKASLPVKLALPPKATSPLEATFTAHMLDVSGLPVERAIGVPVATQSLLLGVKPQASIPPGQSAHFEIIAVSPDGARQEKAGAGWEILRRDTIPSWYWGGRRFAYRPAIKDSHVAGGTIDIPANGSAMLDTSLPAGRYRIEVFDPNGEAISSANFTIGWAPRNAGDPADKVAIKPAKPYYSPGDTADIFVQPPFDADIVLVSADPRIRETAIQHVPAAGATLHLPIPRDAGLGMQLLATAVAPPDANSPGLARRAFGQAMLLADPAPHSLDAKLDLPDVVTPAQTLQVPVTVSGAGEDAVFVRLSAVGEAPEGDGLKKDSLLDPLIGQQLSTVSSADSYGRLITQSGVSSGRMADPDLPGGHGESRDAQQPEQPAPALYSGIVALDKTGKATVPLRLPDFAGKLRVRLVAWSASRSGQDDTVLTVRFPLAVTLPLPPFLTPDDRADIALAIDNAGGPRGEYRISIRGEGAVTVQDQTEAVFNLAEHEKRAQPVTILAHAPGEGAVVLSVKGPNGLAFERRLPMSVRPPSVTITRRAVMTVKPGGTLAMDPSLTAGLRPDMTLTSVSASIDTDFNLDAIARDAMSAGQDSAERIADAAMLAALYTPGDQLERVARRLGAYQNRDGGFSLFGASQSDVWLTAYIADALSTAKGSGSDPDLVLARALDYLVAHIEPAGAAGGQVSVSQTAIATAAYACKMLAQNGRLDIFQLRSLNDRFQPTITNPVASALLAASFARLGDKAAASAGFARAASLPVDPPLGALFGSDLRDQAMLTALMSESGAVAQPAIAGAAGKMAAMAATRREFSGQETAWMLRASALQPKTDSAARLKIGDKAVELAARMSTEIAALPLPIIRNGSDTPLHIALTLTGQPLGDGKDATGYELQRWLFDPAGKQIDPAALHQNDIAVVVLTGRFLGQGEAQPILTDMLPAGWTVEAAEIADPAGRYPWLKDLSGAQHVSAADGRFVAVPRLVGDKHEFRLAYVVRAATRGQFNLPGAIIEDMAQPALSDWIAGGRTKVDPPAGP